MSRGQPAWRQGRGDPSHPGPPRDHRVEGLAGVPRAEQRPSPARRMPGATRRTAVVSSSSRASQARAASRYVLPTIRSWVSTIASARNISHSTALTARIARRWLSGGVRGAHRRSSAPSRGTLQRDAPPSRKQPGSERIRDVPDNRAHKEFFTLLHFFSTVDWLKDFL